MMMEVQDQYTREGKIEGKKLQEANGKCNFRSWNYLGSHQVAEVHGQSADEAQGTNTCRQKIHIVRIKHLHHSLFAVPVADFQNA
jgi:hypothetical protein